MGFCRRCGEIVPVQAARCKCGGSAVAPAVPWNQSPHKDGGSPDRWAKTYVLTKADKHGAPVSNTQAQPPHTPEKSEEDDQRSTTNHSPTRPRFSTPEEGDKRGDANPSPTRPPRRFPRPLSNVVHSISLPDNRVSQHIAPTTAHLTPTKKNITFSFSGSPSSTPADVITSPDNATLAKAYGSILQRPDTLPIHTCGGCSSIFPPDATIYPDPQVPRGATPRFLCRPCFAVQGGSKGNCADCGREVLTATKEGGFIESAGRFWHKRCFRCNSCHKHIGNAPMVDLYGNPSCSECFDTCLDRKDTHRKPLEAANNMGGMRGKSRESSPALEELSERLGIKRQVSPEVNRSPFRETSYSPSPVRPSLSSRQDDSLRGLRQVSPEVNRSISERSVSPSPVRMFSSSHQEDSLRLRSSLGGSRSGTPPRQTKISGLSVTTSAPLRSKTSKSVMPTIPTTPDLFSCSSSSDSLSSLAPSTPSNSPRQSLTSNSDSITPKAKGVLKVVTTGDAKCGRCFQSLFSISGEGQIVTIPADSHKGFPSSYHASCFRCFVCGDIFDGKDQGRATFLKDSRGVCHPECKMAEEYIRPTPPSSAPHVVDGSESIADQPLRTAPPLSRPFPRFGGSESCPGCRRAVSLMEYGVVPGPQNSRWHAVCLVCGGKGAKLPRPGCGKKLDSAAKTDHDGGVWCRECMLLLPVGSCSSPQGSPTRGGLSPSYTGTGVERFPRPDAGRLFGQVTGNNCIKLTDMLTGQCTGGADILRHGSVSTMRPTARSVSPTKGLIPVTRHPRPAGSWKHRSIDEGRGMFLVKQMTGNGQV